MKRIIFFLSFLCCCLVHQRVFASNAVVSRVGGEVSAKVLRIVHAFSDYDALPDAFAAYGLAGFYEANFPVSESIYLTVLPRLGVSKFFLRKTVFYHVDLDFGAKWQRGVWGLGSSLGYRYDDELRHGLKVGLSFSYNISKDWDTRFSVYQVRFNTPKDSGVSVKESALSIGFAKAI